MTGAAIIVDTPGKRGVRSALTVARLMLMVMMTEVLGLDARLVLAIDRHRRPTQLERQKNQQKNGEQATHGEIIPDKSGMADELWSGSANYSIPVICHP